MPERMDGDGRFDKVPEEYVQQGKALEKQKQALVKTEGSTRAAAALQLRINGAGWSDIAELLGFASPTRARQAVEKALAMETSSKEDIEHVRWLNARRMERILSSLMPRAQNPKDADHLAYARTAMVVIDRHIRLYGADAPQQLNVTYSPTAGQIEEWVQTMARQVHGEIIEADIIEEDVVDAEVEE